MSLSVALMAHPRRKPFVDELVEQLDREPEVVWDRRNDRWDTGRRSMLAHDPAADWHLVIQDDAVPCLDLIAGIEKACEHAKDRPLAFYVGGLRPTNVQHQASVLVNHARRRGASWMRMEGPWWGVAIAVPTSHIADMLAWGDRRDNPGPDYIANYDKRISRYYAAQNIDCWYSVPSLVDHREVGENPSLVPGRTGNRQAHSFIGRDRSALDIDWSLTPERNHHMATHRNTQTGNTIDVVAGTALAKLVERDPEWEAVERYGIDVPADQAPAGPEIEADAEAQAGEFADGGVIPVDALAHVEGEAAATDQADPDPTDELADLSRADLNKLAAERGVEAPEKLSNKAAVIEAIEATREADAEAQSA